MPGWPQPRHACAQTQDPIHTSTASTPASGGCTYSSALSIPWGDAHRHAGERAAASLRRRLQPMAGVPEEQLHRRPERRRERHRDHVPKLRGEGGALGAGMGAPPPSSALSAARPPPVRARGHVACAAPTLERRARRRQQACRLAPRAPQRSVGALTAALRSTPFASTRRGSPRFLPWLSSTSDEAAPSSFCWLARRRWRLIAAKDFRLVRDLGVGPWSDIQVAYWLLSVPDYN